jgi:hypothetical protein
MRIVSLADEYGIAHSGLSDQVAASRVPAYVLSVDTEGTSVLTAWV